jgi:hypothetical protein
MCHLVTLAQTSLPCMIWLISFHKLQACSIIVKIDSITRSFYLHHYVRNDLSYSGEGTQPTLYKNNAKLRFRFVDLRQNKHHLLHRIQSVWTFTNLHYYAKNSSKQDIIFQRKGKEMSHDTLVEPLTPSCVIFWHCRDYFPLPSSVTYYLNWPLQFGFKIFRNKKICVKVGRKMLVKLFKGHRGVEAEVGRADSAVRVQSKGLQVCARNSVKHGKCCQIPNWSLISIFIYFVL